MTAMLCKRDGQCKTLYATFPPEYFNLFQCTFLPYDFSNRRNGKSKKILSLMEKKVINEMDFSSADQKERIFYKNAERFFAVK